jgi:hypothetical protein
LAGGEGAKYSRAAGNVEVRHLVQQGASGWLCPPQTFFSNPEGELKAQYEVMNPLIYFFFFNFLLFRLADP